MYFDRYDICLGYWVFFSLHHSGQWSDEYRRLSKLTGYFSPGRCFSEERFLAEDSNAREIYFGICEKHGIAID